MEGLAEVGWLSRDDVQFRVVEAACQWGIVTFDGDAAIGLDFMFKVQAPVGCVDRESA